MLSFFKQKDPLPDIDIDLDCADIEEEEKTPPRPPSSKSPEDRVLDRIAAEHQWREDINARVMAREKPRQLAIIEILRQSEKYDKVVSSKKYVPPQGWKRNFPQGGGPEYIAGCLFDQQQNQKKNPDSPYWKYVFSAWTEEHWLEIIAYVRYLQTLAFMQQPACQFSYTWYRQLCYRLFH